MFMAPGLERLCRFSGRPFDLILSAATSIGMSMHWIGVPTTLLKILTWSWVLNNSGPVRSYAFPSCPVVVSATAATPAISYGDMGAVLPSPVALKTFACDLMLSTHHRNVLDM